MSGKRRKHVPLSLPQAPIKTTVPEGYEDGEKKESMLRRKQKGVRIVALIPEELEREVRIRCAEERFSLSAAVTLALQVFVTGLPSEGESR